MMPPLTSNLACERRTPLSDKPFDTLTMGLLHEDCLVQADAARLLGELRRAETVAPLVRYVRECRNYAKVAGFEALARLGDGSACREIRALVDWPNCPDDWYWYCCRSVRAAAAVALLSLGDDYGAGYLGELADKKDDVFFAWFAPAILRLPDAPPAAAALKARLTAEALMESGPGSTRHTNPGTEAMVAEALGVIGSNEAKAALRQLATHQSRYVRAQAAMGLAAGAASEGDLALVGQLAAGDATDFVKVKASLALVKAGKTEHLDFIAAAAKSLKDPLDPATAIESIGRAMPALHATQYAPIILKRLAHEDSYVRQTAVEALGRLGGASAVGAVKKCLKDPSPRVRLSAAWFFAAREGGAA